ncbi:MAG TPA: hypothetical protein VMU87_00570 [Stellaceae bacterium]|nr:hypothetical protein [Stellaceae bacterium]
MTLQPRSHNRCRTLVAALFLAVLGTGLASAFPPFVIPSKADEDDAAEGTVNAPSRVSVRDGVITLTLDAAAQRNGGIETAPPMSPPSQDSVTGYGTVLDAAPLTDLNNRYRDAKARLQMAQARLTVSRAAYERAKTLYKDRQNISAAKLQSAAGNFQVDLASLAAARSSLATVTASAQQSWGPVLGKALIEDAPLIKHLIERRAYLVKVTLSPGVTVTPPPQTASATLDGGTKIALDFVSPAATTDPEIQGIAYFYEAPAENGVLPGLNVLASLPGAAAARGVVVPESAVVWLQGKAWVYLRTSPNTFIRREIAPGWPGPDGGYIVTGLPEGAQIVVAGAQMLLSEEFRAQAAIGGDQD